MASPRRASDEGRRRIMKACQKGGAKRVDGEKGERRREAPERRRGTEGVGADAVEHGRGGGNLGGSGGGLEYEKRREGEEETGRGEGMIHPFPFHFKEKRLQGGHHQVPTVT
jgi:hypothetical protein